MAGGDETYTITSSSSTTLYITIPPTNASDYTITWYDSNGFNIQLSALEQMKQDFEALAHGFFLEKFDVPFEDRRCPPAFNL
jgi:hypothetical protein